MLVIRMQRTGRRGHAQFRVVVQDSRQSPVSHKVVALVGNYNPHTKVANLESDKISHYLKHGAQPSDRAALLFKKEGIKLPKWVNVDTKKQAKPRHPEKFAKDEPAAPMPATDATTEPVTDTEATTEPSELVAEESINGSQAENTQPAEEKSSETATESDDATEESAAKAEDKQADA